MHAMRRLILAAALAMTSAGYSHALADCTCRAFGRNFELGASACLMTPSGPRLAVCGMVLNNTSWRFSDAACAVIGGGSPAGPAQTPAPAPTAGPAHVAAGSQQAAKLAGR